MNKQLQAAQWIWHPSIEMDNQYVDFLSDFMLTDSQTDVKLYISSDSNYAVWINGKLAATTQYADYPNYKVYDEIDINSFVHCGLNRLCVAGYYQGENSHGYRRGKAGVLWAVTSSDKIAAVSDKNVLCRQSNTYTCGPVEHITPQLLFGFHYDATGEDNWLQPEYKPDTNWKEVKTTGQTVELYPRPVKKLIHEPRAKSMILTQGVFQDASPRVTEIGSRMQQSALAFRDFKQMSGLTAPITLPQEQGVCLRDEGGDGLFIVLDLKQETAGFFTLDLELEEDADILIGYGEHLNDLRVRTFVGGRQFAVQYRAKAGRQQFTHWFKRMGCRYLQLHLYTHAAKVYYAGLIPTSYPLKDTGNFQCSDALHNKIYEVCLRTLKLSVHEHYEDCPWREQAMYTMDSRNQMLCGYYAFGEYDMPKASLRLMTLGQRESGLLELCAPSRVSITIPMLSLSYVTAVYEYAVYSGDYPFVREIMPAVKRVMTAFSSRLTKDNLLSRFTEKEYWNFYEWQDGLDGGLIERDYDITPRLEAPLNGFFAIALQQFACLCDMLNLREDKQWAQDIYGRVKTAINTCFWNESQGSYCSYIEDGKQIHYAELTQALLVCGGVVPEERKAQVLHLLAYPSEKLLPVTLSCTIYKYEALMTETEKYAKLIFNEIQQKWGNMLFSGATSFWETEKGSWDFDNAGSLCHGWSAIPIYYYYAYGLGISPFTTDYKNIDCGLIGAVGNDCLKIHAKVGGK